MEERQKWTEVEDRRCGVFIRGSHKGRCGSSLTLSILGHLYIKCGSMCEVPMGKQCPHVIGRVIEVFVRRNDS